MGSDAITHTLWRRLAACLLLSLLAVATLSPAAQASGAGIRSVAAGHGYSMALLGDGTLRTWGYDLVDTYGPGDINGSAVLVRTPLANITAMAAGYDHGVALTDDGRVWTWGDHRDGEFGDGKAADDPRPGEYAPCPALIGDVTDVKAGTGFTIALKKDGTVWSWGLNDHGQLGDGTTDDRFSPVQVRELDHIKAIFAGPSDSFAIGTDGTVWAWGLNDHGQLGDGTTIDRSAPAVVNITGVKACAPGKSHSVVLKEDGTVWAWGGNEAGQLGDRSTTDRTAPGRVDGLANVTAIASGEFVSMAVKSDGTLWAWGLNLGQFGNGASDGTIGTVPVKVPLEGISSVAIGQDHVVALCSDGSLRAWGRNVYGQLGDGTVDDRAPFGKYSPISVMKDGQWGNSRIVELVSAPVPTIIPTEIPAPSAMPMPTTMPIPTAIPTPVDSIDIVSTIIVFCGVAIAGRAIVKTRKK